MTERLIDIRIHGKTVFINSREYSFCYNMLNLDEVQDVNLQCNFDEDSLEYLELKNRLKMLAGEAIGAIRKCGIDFPFVAVT
jgi:hypothetical protein